MSAVMPAAERWRWIVPGSRRDSHRALAAGLLYEAVVVGAAAGGAVTHEPAYWLALLGLTLPCGIAAFAGLYACYGLLATLGSLLGAHMSASGYGPAWFVIPDGILDVALFAVAGAVNVLLASTLAARPWHTGWSWTGTRKR
jgi:hypothetical protein